MMENQNNNILKLCSFYVSDWHIVTMLLPYINTKINENIKIVPIFEKNIRSNIEILLNKLNLKNKQKILDIDWNEKKLIKYKEINSIIKNNKNEKLIFIINGNKEYIKNANKNLNKSLKENKINNEIKIVNCYEVTEFNENIYDILDENDKILNTSGEKEIKEIFEGYERKIKKIES